MNSHIECRTPVLRLIVAFTAIMVFAVAGQASPIT